MEIKKFEFNNDSYTLLSNMAQFTSSPGHEFEKIIGIMSKHVIEDGRPGIDVDQGICMYRGPDGEKCLIGALIPDEKYYADLEDNDAANATVYKVCSDLGYKDVWLLVFLQNCHDNLAQLGESAPCPEWRNGLLYLFACILKRFCDEPNNPVRNKEIFKTIVSNIDEDYIDMHNLKKIVSDAIAFASSRIVQLAYRFGYNNIVK